MLAILRKRYSEDLRTLEFIRAMRATGDPATVELALPGRTDTVAFPRIILAGTPL